MAGSPLMMAQLADKCASWAKPVSLKLINVEADPNNFKSLEHVTEPWVKRGIVKNIPGDFSSSIPEVLSDIGQDPAFFFIDPYGPTYVYFSDLRPILNRGQRATELIINFDADGLRRIADTMNSSATEPRTVKAVQTNLENVSKIIGSSLWKEIFEGEDLSAQEREQVLLREYLKNITKYDYTATAYGIRESIGRPNKYFFVYCTRHADGIILMNNFVREEEDEMFQEETGKRLPLFETEGAESNRALDERRAALRINIYNYMSGVIRATRKDIKRDLIYQNFGQYHEKDYSHVIYELVKAGKLRAESGKKRFNDSEVLHYVPTVAEG